MSIQKCFSTLLIIFIFLMLGQVEVFAINSNTNLNLDITDLKPSRDDLGDIITELDVAYGEWAGLAWARELMWGLDVEEDVLIGVNEEGEIVEMIDLPLEDADIEEGFSGLCFDGQCFWLGSFERPALFRIDFEGELIQTLEIEGNEDGAGAFGVAWDGRNLWYILAEGDAVLRQITFGGEVIREVNCEEVEFADELMNITWVPDHLNGHLWAHGCDEHVLYQLNINEDDAEIIQETRIEPDEAFGIAHDGVNLWFQSTNEDEEESTWFIIDDATRV